MKALYTLSAILLMAFSLQTFAADKIANLRVPLAPMVWGDTNDPAPLTLGYIKTVNADVPLAFFVWGSQDEPAPLINETCMSVPLAN